MSEKRRDELCEKYHESIQSTDKHVIALKWEYMAAWKAGWDARNQDFQVLKEALERINHPGTWLDAVDSENAGDYIVNIAKQALEKVGGEG